MTATLSVICPTRDPGPRVTALLAQLRPVADEIVVAIDAAVDLDRLREYAGVADRLLRWERRGPDRSPAWLHRQCAGDWVLLLAGDEVASPALVAALPELIRARTVQQYWVPRRWLFPDAEHWLDELPWAPDYQNRLVRNDGTLWFPGEVHTYAGPVLPAHYLDTPIYHLDCVLTPLVQREAKAAGYEQVRPDLSAPGGGELNRSFFLPERTATRAPEPVPSEDAAAIAAVLRPPPVVEAEPGPVPLAAAAEVEAHWAGREFAEEGYSAVLAPAERDHRMVPGERRAVHVRVTNTGTEHWPWVPEQHPMIRLAYRWYAVDGRCIVAEGLRSSLPAAVEPGQTFVAPLVVVAPDEPGRHVLEVDLVHEPVRWFDVGVRVEVDVRQR